MKKKCQPAAEHSATETFRSRILCCLWPRAKKPPPERRALVESSQAGLRLPWCGFCQAKRQSRSDLLAAKMSLASACSCQIWFRIATYSILKKPGCADRARYRRGARISGAFHLRVHLLQSHIAQQASVLVVGPAAALLRMPLAASFTISVGS